MNLRSVLQLLLSAVTLTAASRLDGGRGFFGEETVSGDGASSTNTTESDGGRAVHFRTRKLSSRSCKGTKGSKGKKGCVEPAFCTNLTTFEGHLYVHMPTPINWPDANAEVKTLPKCCGGKEAHLVTLTSAKENDFVYNLAPIGLPWTGLFFNYLTNEYIWADGEPYPGGNFSGWPFGIEPPGTPRDPCGYLSEAVWDLARCDDVTSGYVAEYDCE